ncbi:MAG: hypothetical protein P9M03_03420 [Candidatus Theseobacter exili]|nr:hypothetical protein [Candidatus Theseobacter exili]
MSHELRYDSDIDCIFLCFQGRVTIELITEIAPEVARMSAKTGCHRLLNNMSAATVDISISDLYYSPEVMDKSGVLRTLKKALVVPPSFDESGFLEDVTRNRGHNLMVFKDIENAKKWLFDK